MTLENKVQSILGQQSFQIAALAQQLEEAQEKIKQLEDKKETKK